MGPKEATEILAKWTTEIYFRGFRILLTQPFENAAAIVGLMNQLAGLGFTPTPIFDSPPLLAAEMENKEASQETETPICPTHNKPMVQRGGKVWQILELPHQVDGRKLLQISTSEEIITLTNFTPPSLVKAFACSVS